MIESFSSGYFKADVNVEPYKNGPTIGKGLDEYIRTTVYYGTSSPVIFRVGLSTGPHFSTETESAIPDDVLGIPEEWMDEHNISRGDDVFIVKPEHSEMISYER